MFSMISQRKYPPPPSVIGLVRVEYDPIMSGFVTPYFLYLCPGYNQWCINSGFKLLYIQYFLNAVKEITYIARLSVMVKG